VPPQFIQELVLLSLNDRKPFLDIRPMGGLLVFRGAFRGDYFANLTLCLPHLTRTEATNGDKYAGNNALYQSLHQPHP
jgi:hypothetical protein